MGIATDIEEFTKDTFRARWDEREGRVVPEPQDLTLGNQAIKFDEAAILYADLSDSTKMVDAYSWAFAAEVYKVFLNAAARLIKHHDGSITAYDGDRVMGVFLGGMKRTNAARCGLRINYAVTQIIQSALKTQYPAIDFTLQHTVGVDCSAIRAARTGVRGDNDIVWVGGAANYAAKMSDISELPYATFVSQNVYDKMDAIAKIYNGTNMWEQRTWEGKTVYRSNWWLSP